MTLFRTLEIRWFFQERTDALTEWLHSQAFAAPETRTDHYYKPALDEGIGLKWREGNLEWKAREGSFQIEGLPLSLWAKRTLWKEKTMSGAASPADWLEVHKTRQVLSRGKPGNQARFEHCTLAVGDQRWQSFAVECDAADSAAMVSRFRETVLPEIPVMHLPETARCLDYPGFLVRFS